MELILALAGTVASCAILLGVIIAQHLERARWDRQRHELMIRLSSRNEPEAQAALERDAIRRAVPDVERAAQENAKVAGEVAFQRAYGDDNRFNRRRPG